MATRGLPKIIKRSELVGDPRKKKPKAGSSPTAGKAKLIKKKKGPAKRKVGPAPKTSPKPKRKGIQTKKLAASTGRKAASKVEARKRATKRFRKKRDDR